MDLIKLFETQKLLDSRIVEEKGLKGKDFFPEKILALLAELGELSNEWRGFKFWSEDRKPRIKVPVTAWGEPYKNPLLEEYVDCLHFILSIGLEIHPSIANMEWVKTLNANLETLGEPGNPNITGLFLLTFEHAHLFSLTFENSDYGELFFSFLTLGRALGFTFEQIETAYYEKNVINHKRQENGY